MFRYRVVQYMYNISFWASEAPDVFSRRRYFSGVLDDSILDTYCWVTLNLAAARACDLPIFSLMYFFRTLTLCVGILTAGRPLPGFRVNVLPSSHFEITR